MATATLTLDQPTAHEKTAARRGRILELDGLRGMAIVLVILFHYVAIVPAAPHSRIEAYLQRAFAIGWSGVDLFFVLSGFLIGGILLDAKRSQRYFKTFYGRRVLRIFPIYYLWIAAYFLLAFIASRHLSEHLGIVQGSWIAAPVLAFFLQNTWKLNATLTSIWFFQMWSLAVEEQFYLVIPLLIRFLSKSRLVFTLLLLIFLAPLSRILLKLYVPSDYWGPHLLTFCRSDELAFGVLLAVLWKEAYWKSWVVSHKKIIYCLLGVLSPGMIYLAAFNPSDFTVCAWGYSCIALFFASLLLLALAAPGGIWASFCRTSILKRIGAVSYCMYIVHAVVNRACHVLLAASTDGIATRRSLAATILATGLTWFIAECSWRLLESQFVRRGHAFRY